MAERFKVVGMHCASCAINIEKRLKKQEGVKDVSVNYATEEAKVDFDETTTSMEKLSESIQPLGYHLQKDSSIDMTHGPAHTEGMDMSGMRHSKVDHMSHGMEDGEVKKLQTRVTISLPLVVISALVMLWQIFSVGINILPTVPENFMRAADVILLFMASYMLFVVGRPYLKGVWSFMRHGVANMDTLVGIGTLAAYTYSLIVILFEGQLESVLDVNTKYFDVTIIVIGLITLGKYLEIRSKKRAGDAIKKLLGLQVKTALVLRNGKEQEISIDQVQHGDLVLVKPGMKIPVDGFIQTGTSSIDESMLTGEPMPITRSEGEKVSAGTINTSGSFTMKATGVGGETLLAHIVEMVKEAQGSRAPIQNLADKISAVFVPIVLIVSALTLLTWIFIGSRFMPFQEAMSFGLVTFVSVLVIACPCALGLATPTAIIVGVGKAALQGILIKNAEVLETLHKITALVIDKTGTITEGKPHVVEFEVTTSLSQDEALSLMASLEKSSEHPLGKSIVEYAKLKGLTLKSVQDFHSIPGKGVKGTIHGIEYFIGNPAFISDKGVKVDSAIFEKPLASGATVVLLANKKEVLAYAGIGDTLKNEAREAIQGIQKMGIKVIMATGDHEISAKHFASQVGISEVIAEVSPEDKLKKIKELQQAGHKVAMAGDGVNDAPALAQADVGIAMSTGTDVSIETSDATLLEGDISKIDEAIRLSKLTMRTVKQNLFWAFIYNIIGIPLATGIFYPIFGWLLSPIVAGLAMAFSSVSVVFNSLRLKTRKI